MITKLYELRKLTPSEVSAELAKYQKAGLTPPDFKVKRYEVYYEADKANVTTFLRNIVAKIRNGKKGEDVKVASYDYQKGEVTEKSINPAIAGKLLNCAIQNGVDNAVIEEFSATLFDEDGYFMQAALSTLVSSAEKNATHQNNLSKAIRDYSDVRAQKEANKAKDAPKK